MSLLKTCTKVRTCIRRLVHLKKKSTVIRPKKWSRSVRRLKDSGEMTGLAVGLVAVFISGESFRL